MKQGMRTTALLVVMALTSAVCAAQDRIALSYKAHTGQAARYKSEGALSLEAGGNKVTLDIKEVEKVTFGEVAANGNITMERATESSEVTMNGNKLPDSDDDKSQTTLTLRPDGSLVAYKSISNGHDDSKTQIRLYIATSPIFTDKSLAAGDKWNREIKSDSDLGLRAAKTDYEVVGLEKIGGVDTVKIKMAYQETEGSSPLTCNGTLWIEKSSGDAIVADFDIENIPFGEGEQSALAHGKIHGERIEGSPLGDAKSTGAKVDMKADSKGQTKTDARPEAKKEKTIDETVKDFEKLPGLFTLYRKRETGRDTIYMEIKESQLDKLLMLEVTASTGTSDMYQIIAGDPINDILFKFVKSGDEKILLCTPNINFRASDKLPIARALKRSFADAYLDAYKIEAAQPDRKSLLINVSDLFRGDIAQISSKLNLVAALRGGGYTMDRDKTYIAALKNFPENLVVQTAYHFTRSGGGGAGSSALFGSSALADDRSIPLLVDYTLFALPADGYRPRLADPRVGYFTTEYQDFNDDSRDESMVRYIYRWQMEKAEPKLALSPPKKPIVFWLDNAIPVEYRDAVRQGLLYWNRAFEQVGIKDAIQVKQMPDNADWDHADMRYNTIRWVTSPNNAYAVALARVNPITGQILNANITVDAGMTHYSNLEHVHLVDPATFFADAPAPDAHSLDPRRCDMAAGAMEQAWFGSLALSMLSPADAHVDTKTYTTTFIRDTVSHEMGHIMGLRHNFIASTYHTLDQLADENTIRNEGITASVMDYNPFNISALKHKGVDYWTPRIGPYDLWAIKYGYMPINASTPEGERYVLNQIASQDSLPGHAYESDEIADQFDPAVVRFDLGRDPLAYWNRMLDTSRYLMFHLGEREPKHGESYWKFTQDFYRLLNMYARAASVASRYVGGMHVSRNFRGDPGEKPTLFPVDAAEQKRALSMLNTYIFAENAFDFPKSYYAKLTANPFIDFGTAIFTTAQEQPVRDQMAGIQKAALQRLFSPGVLRRIVNSEFRVSDSAQALTLPTLYNSVGTSVWSELDSRKNIGSLRRQLQRTHLDTLIAMVVGPPAGTPDDARMLAWDQLRQIKARITAASRHTQYDDYTRVHLAESRMRIDQALDAKVMIGSQPAR